jgi:dGTPase
MLFHKSVDSIREITELNEQKFLSVYASKSSETRGRKVQEEKCTIRTDYQRDRDRILHSNSFRRLKHKTQVFISPEGDHYRTRLTHTLEVSQIARTIARALRLNEDLAEAIALGHDLGHTPFGHSGEYVLNKICPGGFKHSKQSVKVVELLEKHGAGLNLTYEVIDGIANHTGDDESITLEGKIVKFADKIAYINHDIDDSIRAGVITEKDIPKEISEVFGTSHSSRINFMIKDLIENSIGQDNIIMSEQAYNLMMELRSFMFKNVYIGSKAKAEEEKARELIVSLYKYFNENIDKLPEQYNNLIQLQGKETTVCDYIAGMTDRYAVYLFKEMYIPKSWGI